jgi:hypothetical protein
MAKIENSVSVVYNVETTAIVRAKPFVDAVFKSMGAAKACKTRLVKNGKYTAEQLEVADYVVYKTLIEATVEKTNMMSGKTYRESVNTPNYCSPSSEAYWSM